MTAAYEAASTYLEARRDGLIGFLRALIATPSITIEMGERAIADLLLAHAGALGLPAPEVVYARPEHPNLLYRLTGPAAGPTLILNAHLDTQPVGDGAAWSRDPFGGQVEDDRLYGLGSSDMKGAVAAMVYAMAALAEAAAPSRGTLLLALVANEEDGGTYGADWLAREYGLTGDACVVFAWQVEGGIAVHALPADQDVLDCVGESVAHVELARHVGWGHDDGVGGFVGVALGREVALGLPPVVPAGLDVTVAVGFGHRFGFACGFVLYIGHLCTLLYFCLASLEEALFPRLKTKSPSSLQRTKGQSLSWYHLALAIGAADAVRFALGGLYRAYPCGLRRIYSYSFAHRLGSDVRTLITREAFSR